MAISTHISIITLNVNRLNFVIKSHRMVCVSGKLLQLCLTLSDPVDCGLPGSSVHGILYRQEHWSELPCPPPGDLPNPGIEPESLMSPALAGVFFTISVTWEAPNIPK